MPKPKQCHFCHKSVEHSDLIDGLFCSTTCRDAHAAQDEAIRQLLIDDGFTQHPTIQNVYVKDGVAVTTDEVLANGIDNALAAHTRALR